jgi:hypothetical protein
MQQNNESSEQFIQQNGIVCEVLRQATTAIAFPIFIMISLLTRPARWIWDLGVSPEERKRYGKT